MNLKPIRTARLGADRGATDPILVIAAIAVSLVLLVGGSFAISGIISNGHNLNAKADLGLVHVAETAYYAETDTFIAYRQSGSEADRQLEESGIGFKPTEGGDLSVVLSPAPNASGGAVVAGQTAWGWAAISHSSAQSGQRFVRTSISQTTSEVDFSSPTWRLKGATAGQTNAELEKLGITIAELKASLG